MLFLLFYFRTFRGEVISPSQAAGVKNPDTEDPVAVYSLGSPKDRKSNSSIQEG